MCLQRPKQTLIETTTSRANTPTDIESYNRRLSTFTNIPGPTENVTVTYKLYTPDNPDPTIIDNIEDLKINTEHELKILCHGWTYNKYTTDWYKYTIDEYMKKGNVSVITANYKSFIKNVQHYNAIKYAMHIGTDVGNFTLKLNKIKGVEFDKIHFIGHLIGAHIAGVAGERVYEESGKYIDRITGIDPISLGYFKFPTPGKLDRNNAKFVDVIHINSYISQKPLGRVDFYGYSYMVRCARHQYSRKQLGPIFYANSINGEQEIIATKCNKKVGNFFSRNNCQENITAVLGENIDRESFGQFYLKEADISKHACEHKEKKEIAINEVTETNEV